MEVIQSKQNASIKTARKLLQRKHRKTSYLIEGWHLFEEAKASGAHILQIFVLEEMADRVANMSKVKLVSPEVLKELCETQTPQGIVAEVAKQTQALPDSLSGKYLLLEDVQDPGNVGTMIRTADAADYDGVFLSDKSADAEEKTHGAGRYHQGGGAGSAGSDPLLEEGPADPDLESGTHGKRAV